MSRSSSGLCLAAVRAKASADANAAPIFFDYFNNVLFKEEAKGDFVLKTVATIVKDNQDVHHTKCPMK